MLRVDDTVHTYITLMYWFEKIQEKQKKALFHITQRTRKYRRWSPTSHGHLASQ